MQGPFFVSIGDADKLETFLELNPGIPREDMFVDGYDFTAYRGAGFGRVDEQDRDVVRGVKLTAPSLPGGLRGWGNYFGNVMKLSPVPDDLTFGEIPEGVLRLGGTFVVKGDEVVYQWSDRLPGDHPDVQKVAAVAQAAASAPSSPTGAFAVLEDVFRNLLT